MMKTAIIGATGYGGAELIRILNQHPKVEVTSVHSSSQAGTKLSDTYPHLQGDQDLVLEDINPKEIAKKVDVVFLATPSGISTSLTPQLLAEGLKVIDLSGDYRLKNPDDFTTWYKKTPASQEQLNKSVYGLPEWYKEEIKEATLIANPGCYPTATLLGLAPLLKNSLIQKDSIVIDAKSGVSGAGRTPSMLAHFPEMNNNFRIYKVNQHQHIPEIEQELSRWNEIEPITFSTHLLPITRGIMATIYAKVNQESDVDQLLQLYKDSYQGAPFVRVREKGKFPSTKEVFGSNYCDIGIAYDERTKRIMVVSAIDNLVKGASGQAVQNLNIMMGLDEKTGLDHVPMYP